MPLEERILGLEADFPRSGDEFFIEVWERAEKAFRFLL
jgi:hypothetical protein